MSPEVMLSIDAAVRSSIYCKCGHIAVFTEVMEGEAWKTLMQTINNRSKQICALPSDKQKVEFEKFEKHYRTQFVELSSYIKKARTGMAMLVPQLQFVVNTDKD